MEVFTVDPERVRDISGLLLDSEGKLRVVPAGVLQGTTAEERLLFGVRHGFYGFPTEELCSFLQAVQIRWTAIPSTPGERLT